MNCPKCNFEIPEGTFFCGECGTKIDTTPLCKNCAAPLSGGVLFCPNCGTPAASNDTLATDVSLEPDIAGEPVQVKAEEVPQAVSFVREEAKEAEADKEADDAQVSAVKSRDDIEEKLERTMTIPIIKHSAYTPEAAAPKHTEPKAPVNPAVSPGVPVQAMAPRGVSSPSALQQMNAMRPATSPLSNGNTTLRQAPPEPKVRKTKAEPSKKDDGQTQKNILIFLIVFLLVILIGLLSIILVMSLTKDDTFSDTAPKETQSEDKDKDSEKKEQKDKKETKDEDDKKDKGKKNKKNTSSSLPPEDYIVKVDYDFDFAFGEDLDPEDYTTRRYMIYEDIDYSFECDVPSGFRHDFTDDVEVRYRASDNTAYMDIGAYYNDASLSVDDVMDNTIDSLGGTVSYEADGDDWFSVSHENDGVVYYQKCFVDEEYIRYFEFVYPEEYSDIYHDYVTDIEANYKRTE